VLAIDEGSSSARAVIVDPSGRIVAEDRCPVVPSYPQRGWVELDPVALWQAQRSAVRSAVARAGITGDSIAAIGITTHRETCLVWDRRTGVPVHPALMWMSKQTDSVIETWRHAGLDDEIRSRTGLFNDSFFSAAKLAWILNHVPGARSRAEAGELAAVTVDTWLLWQMTSGRSHLTDHSEASRTALFSIADLQWDETLLVACGVPPQILAPAVASDSFFGEAVPAEIGIPGSAPIPILAVMADQQAGMFGQVCFTPGAAKNTFGTAGVLTCNAGPSPLIPNGLTGSVGWTIGGKTDYEVEGVVFHSGQTLQWMRDRLRVLATADDIEDIAGSVSETAGVYVVPAFAGICAPYWARDAQAAIVGLTLETEAAHVVRAGVEAMAYQTLDNVHTLVSSGIPIPQLKVDGGAARSDLLCQFQADILGVPVVRPTELERTALGAAQVAGIGAGVWSSSEMPDHWHIDRVFEPRMSVERREELVDGWHAAVEATLGMRRNGHSEPAS